MSRSVLFTRFEHKLPRFALERLALLGPILFISIQFVLRIEGLKFDYWRSGPWQLLPKDVLANEPIQSLWYLHIQPLGFNFVTLLLDRIGPTGELIWQVFIIAATSVSIWMSTGLVSEWTNQLSMGILVGVIYALLPGTHLYAMWYFYTQPTSIALVFMAYGVVKGRTSGKSSYFILSMFSVTTLFLWRSSILWFMAVIWIVFVLYLAIKDLPKKMNQKRAKLLIFGSLFISIIFLLTAKNFILFGSSSQSSWAPENFAKVLLYTASEKELSQIASQDPCFEELINVGVFKDISYYPVCTSDYEPDLKSESSALVLIDQIWPDGIPNFNGAKRFALQSKWRDFDTALVKSDPKIIFRALWPSFSAERRGSIVQFISISTDYVFLEDNRRALGSIGRIWEIGTSWIPPLSLVFWSYFLVFRRNIRDILKENKETQLGISVFMLILLLEYIFLEIGENQRYRAELEPLILVMGFTGFNLLLQRFKKSNQ
jgi:hypothetical protein